MVYVTPGADRYIEFARLPFFELNFSEMFDKEVELMEKHRPEDYSI